MIGKLSSAATPIDQLRIAASVVFEHGSKIEAEKAGKLVEERKDDQLTSTVVNLVGKSGKGSIQAQEFLNYLLASREQPTVQFGLHAVELLGTAERQRFLVQLQSIETRPGVTPETREKARKLSDLP